MFRLFKLKKGERLLLEPPVRDCNSTRDSGCELIVPPLNSPDSKMVRLMELIVRAIEAWTTEYHLENLPRKIVFEQALDAMRIIELTMNFQER